MSLDAAHPLVTEFFSSMFEGEVQRGLGLLRQHPELLSYTDAFTKSWLYTAARFGHLAVIDYLLGTGESINRLHGIEGSTALDAAVRADELPDRIALVRALVERGADPNISRTLIDAINPRRGDEATTLELVRLLVEVGGADVNREYDLFGNKDNTFTALEFAEGHGRHQIAAYLRSKGAVDRPAKPAPVTVEKPKKGGKSKAAAATGKKAANPAAEVVAYFEQEFGPVDPKSLTEVVPTTDPVVRIHIVRPNPKARCVTLFTTGLSTRPMAVPDGAEAYRFAELFVQLPADWPLDLKTLGKLKSGWPVKWLRDLAGVPAAAGTFLGPGWGTVGNGDPPEPVAPGLPFTTALLMAERNFVRGDGETVQLYRLTPLTAPEWQLLQQKGIEALGDALDAADVGVVINPGRASVA